MPVDFKKLLTDKKAFPDDFKITLADGGEVSLSDLRAYNDSVGGELQKELERQRKELAAERTKIDKASSEIANMYVELERERAALPKVNSNRVEDPLDQYRDDPIAQQLKAFRDDIRNQLTELKDKELKSLKQSIAEMGVTYLNDRARGEFAEISKDPDFSDDLTLEGLYKHAVDRGWKEKNGVPNLKRAYEDVIGPKRVERQIKEAKETAIREYEERKKAEALLPRPAGSGLRTGLPEGVKAPKNLNDAINLAAQDASIWVGQN